MCVCVCFAVFAVALCEKNLLVSFVGKKLGIPLIALNASLQRIHGDGECMSHTLSLPSVRRLRVRDVSQPDPVGEADSAAAGVRVGALPPGRLVPGQAPRPEHPQWYEPWPSSPAPTRRPCGQGRRFPKN